MPNAENNNMTRESTIAVDDNNLTRYSNASITVKTEFNEEIESNVVESITNFNVRHPYRSLSAGEMNFDVVEGEKVEAKIRCTDFLDANEKNNKINIEKSGSEMKWPTQFVNGKNDTVFEERRDLIDDNFSSLYCICPNTSIPAGVFYSTITATTSDSSPSSDDRTCSNMFLVQQSLPLPTPTETQPSNRLIATESPYKTSNANHFTNGNKPRTNVESSENSNIKKGSHAKQMEHSSKMSTKKMTISRRRNVDSLLSTFDKWQNEEMRSSKRKKQTKKNLQETNTVQLNQHVEVDKKRESSASGLTTIENKLCSASAVTSENTCCNSKNTPRKSARLLEKKLTSLRIMEVANKKKTALSTLSNRNEIAATSITENERSLSISTPSGAVKNPSPSRNVRQNSRRPKPNALATSSNSKCVNRNERNVNVTSSSSSLSNEREQIGSEQEIKNEKPSSTKNISRSKVNNCGKWARSLPNKSVSLAAPTTHTSSGKAKEIREKSPPMSKTKEEMIRNSSYKIIVCPQCKIQVTSNCLKEHLLQHSIYLENVVALLSPDKSILKIDLITKKIENDV